MGVASGILQLTTDECPFELLRSHCEHAAVPINSLDVEVQFIDTQVIPDLKVYRSDGLEIVSEVGACITGMEEEGYQISVLGIPYPFYEEEFARLRQAYDEQFGISETQQ